uniref:TIR domain-containing protein n=1 Tax=Candidatus Kentrum sp. TUN TaxID=2126343 RepID=A0A450ZYB9_9GAMM|nr:MAG: TIR domain-containing protein [Candidatus Kentron sp. TUN]
MPKSINRSLSTGVIQNGVAKLNGYENDIFISYKRGAQTDDWVANYLAPLIRQWLPECRPPHWKTKVFIDRNISIGDIWQETLQQNLAQSRILLPVFSNPYFGSQWCLDEFMIMRERERILGLNGKKLTSGIIYPLVFWDGDYFPDAAKEIEWRPMHKWAQLSLNKKLRGSLEREIRVICEDLSKMIDAAPAFDPTWPVLRESADTEHPEQNMEQPFWGSHK